MAGLNKNVPTPTEIKIHQQSRLMEVAFGNGANFKLPYEYLRVYSPSAEVRGHGPGQEILQTGKRNVEIVDIAPVGNYAVQLYFSDDHNTGIYSWDLLYELGANQEAYWQAYLERLNSEGGSRDVDTTVVPGKSTGGCGGGGDGKGCGH